MTRYRDMAELLGGISPDVEIVDSPRRLAQEMKKVAEQRGNDAEKDAEKKEAEKAKRQALENDFHAIWHLVGGCTLQREYRFHAKRLWRLDFAIPQKKIAIEIQGGLGSAKSGHRSREGVERDYEKINEAQFAGWQVFQVTKANIQDTRFIQRLVDYAHDAKIKI